MYIDLKYFLGISGLIFTLSLVACGKKKSAEAPPSPALKAVQAPRPTSKELKQNLLSLAPIVVRNCKKALDRVITPSFSPPPDLWELKVDMSPCKNNPKICNDLIKLTKAYSYADFKDDRNYYKVAEQKRDDIIAHSPEDSFILSDQVATLHHECFGHVKRLAENIPLMMRYYSELEKKGSKP